MPRVNEDLDQILSDLQTRLSLEFQYVLLRMNLVFPNQLKSLDMTNIKLKNPKVQKKVAGAMGGGKGLKELMKVCEKQGEKKDPVGSGGGETKAEEGEEGGEGEGEVKKKKKKKKKKR